MHLIACEVFRPELERLTRAMRNAPEVTYLEQGLHDTPDELRRRVQQAVDALEAKGETIIFLAYGLCGRGLTGVTGHTATLILPRVHDCIPVLLGATQEQANESSLGGGTYWLSPGWLRYSQTSFIQNREKRFKEYEERFGTDSAAYLIELEGSWLRNYTNACLILWEDWEDERELVPDRQSRGRRRRAAATGNFPETRISSKPCSTAARTGASCASLPASRRSRR